MRKFTYEEKLEAVLRVVDDHLTIHQSARILGTHKSSIQKWLYLYKEHGPEGLKMKAGSYTGEFKQNVIEYMHNNHLSMRQTAGKFGIPSPTVVNTWERIYCEKGPQGLYSENRGRKTTMKQNKSTQKKVGRPKKIDLSGESREDLIAEVQRLRMENEYLKKLNALVQERIALENGNEPPSSMN